MNFVLVIKLFRNLIFFWTWSEFCSLSITASFFPSSNRHFSLLLLFSCPAVSDSLRFHGLQHARPPCPSCSCSFALVMPSCHLILWHRRTRSSSSAINLSQLTFPMSQFFASDNPKTGVSASVSVLPVGIQGWFPLRLTDLILPFKGLSGVFCSTTVWRHQFLLLCLLYGPPLTIIRDHWEDPSLDYMDLC